jgi:hypothetical protein
VKRRPTATSLGCPFFIAVRRFSAGARFVCRDTARLDRRPGCPAPLCGARRLSHMPSGRFFAPAIPFRPSFQVLDCNSGMSRSRQTLAGSRIADFTLMLIWAPEQPTMCPTRKLPRYATFRQIKGPH